MANHGTLKLTLTDVRGKALQEDTFVSLRHQVRGTITKVTVKAAKSVTIPKLLAQPDGVYRVEIDPPSYLRVGHFVSIKPTGPTPLEVVFPIDPVKAKVRFPPHADLSNDAKRILRESQTVRGFENISGKDLYDALDDERRATLLNIFAKTATTTFANGQSVLSFVSELRDLRSDRFYAVVPQALREETKNAIATGLFKTADDLLHHPPAGFDRAGSFKTLDKYGNLQLSFFARGDDWQADIDIDNASGVEHVFQVIDHALLDRKTHPYDIHQLLVQYQKLDPGYELSVA